MRLGFRLAASRAIVARNDYAEALARVLRQFGVQLIRGAGAAGRSGDRGGRQAAHGLIASLREGYSVVLTGGVPPGPTRKCSPSIIMISSRTGRPVIPFAAATSRYSRLNRVCNTKGQDALPGVLCLCRVP